VQRVFEPWTDERENQLAVLIERLALLCSSWAELGVTEILRLESTSFATLREYNTQSRQPPLPTSAATLGTLRSKDSQSLNRQDDEVDILGIMEKFSDSNYGYASRQHALPHLVLHPSIP